MQFYEISICHVMIFRLYTVFNKHEMIKIGNQIREKSQKCSNSFVDDCTVIMLFQEYIGKSGIL